MARATVKPLEKFARNVLPPGHTKDSFECFGPVSERDGEFEGTNIADLMCFSDGKNNKYFHAAICKSKIGGGWFVYTQWGRLGSTSDFQFYACSNDHDASKIYCKHLHSKNDLRGEWKDGPLGKPILNAKPGKDLYLVRPQTTRKCGLPSARTVCNEQVKIAATSAGSSGFDAESLSLLTDLNLGAASYTRSSMSDESLPTKAAIDEARQLLEVATKTLNQNKPNEQILKDVTKLLYSRIPKRVAIGQTIRLDSELVARWFTDLEAFEGALFSSANTAALPDYGFKLVYLGRNSEIGKFVCDYFESATANRHAYIPNKVRVKNLWGISRPMEAFNKNVSDIVKTDSHRPEFQPSVRKDLDSAAAQAYNKSGTFLLIHGTRSVNIGSIMQNGLRLPKTLANVQLNNQYYGNGIYVSDDIKKSYGFTSALNSHWVKGDGAIPRRNAFMFLADVTCGNMQLVSNNTNANSPAPGHHSIFAKANYSTKGWGKLENNEFVIFNTDQINLRYLVEVEYK